MNIILLQTPLTQQEFNQLLKEFPQYIFLSLTDFDIKKMSEDDWARVEVLFGDHLNEEELEMAHQLRWIHSPSPHVNRICMKTIEDQGNILVTNTKEENIYQIGEYVMAGIMAFSKNLFRWFVANQSPEVVWDSKWRNNIWTLEDRVLVQIGLGRVGSEIARRAQSLGMRVWGVQERASFHEHCNKIFAYKDLHSVLPKADVVSIALPRGIMETNWFRKEELELMKEDSILTIIGPKNVVNEMDLVEVGQTGKFRGILFDAFYPVPIPPTSPLWDLENMIITPEVAPRPKDQDSHAFRLFRYNMRQYQYGNINDMRNVITHESV